MDTTKNYIKRCGKSTGIQKLWQPQEGDWIVLRSSTFHPQNITFVLQDGLREGEFVIQQFREEDEYFDKDKSIWLLRQDQLQRMLNSSFSLQLIDLENIVKEGDWHNVNSMEQLWLNFVMRKCYRKTWNGEDWITQS